MIKNASIAQEFTPIISGSSAGSANVGLYFCNISASPETIIYTPHLAEKLRPMIIPLSKTFLFTLKHFLLWRRKVYIRGRRIIGASSIVGGRVTGMATSIDI